MMNGPDPDVKPLIRARDVSELREQAGVEVLDIARQLRQVDEDLASTGAELHPCAHNVPVSQKQRAPAGAGARATQ